MVGQSPEMVQLRSRIAAIADSDTAVLITGESGTGKELVARAHAPGEPAGHRPDGHRERRRPAGRAWWRPSCSATSAAPSPGPIAGGTAASCAAHNGTLFLDEIGDLPLEAQAKLLRVLQEGTFEPLGTSKTVRVDVRLISGDQPRPARRWWRRAGSGRTCCSGCGCSRSAVPPLRQRVADLPLLVARLLDRLARARASRDRRCRPPPGRP